MDLPRVLRPFIRDDGSIVSIPAKASKRRLLLEYLAAAFEPGVRMTEVEVNAVLRAFYEHDPVSLRRYLIDAALLSREDGVYWRSGGYVDV
ncbi:DUF2087 domain-containing protein [Catelliglobosispora koreensis]|uniref:DUF2087 domain-containing protein n=1 Tax=Catelliglobosispora koreensis TaxID=129052 RepID=UPI00036B4537|nr:DUF2087 domain-containing protein [Catelliglobosispora koreensis]